MEREKFKEDAKKKIDDFFKKLDELESKQKAAQGEAKAAYKERMEELRAKQEELQGQYLAVVEASETRWKEAQETFNDSFKHFQEGFSTLMSMFQPKK